MGLYWQYFMCLVNGELLLRFFLLTLCYTLNAHQSVFSLSYVLVFFILVAKLEKSRNVENFRARIKGNPLILVKFPQDYLLSSVICCTQKNAAFFFFFGLSTKESNE